jgi:hypothetical protein
VEYGVAACGCNNILTGLGTTYLSSPSVHPGPD